METFLRPIAAFFALLLISRVLGKKQIRQITAFNYISSIAFGACTAMLAFNLTLPFWPQLAGMFTWGALSYITEQVAQKSRRIRLLLEGEPTVVIKQGKILEKSLGKEKMNVEELIMLLRQQQIFSLTEVDYAILEPDGQLSILKKMNNQPATKQDLQTGSPKAAAFGVQIVSDGQVLTHNLQTIKRDQTWLDQQLRRQKIPSLHSVFYAEVQKDGKLYVDKRKDQPY
ncbi:DUF421 domain-containing protein [Tumebacillus algifaecis]|uniref:DUF421 domain-containing protein n=1 Tax=Tumebacillus algifaecis TaxID=1214604 RepID=UPI001D13119E|nr:DUF421 domain-containing protein [Tumebacillus algifaecis]